MKQVVEISNCQVLFLISKSWPKVGGMCVCKKRGLGSAPIWCCVAPCQHGDCCQEAAKWHFQSCALFVGVFNSWSHVFFCKFSCGHGGCCLLCASLTLWFPAQLALPGDLGYLNQGRYGEGQRPFAKWASPWVWEDAQVPGHALSNCCLQAEEEEEEAATMDSLLMQEESWKGEQVLHYFPIFLAHGTAQTSLWCLKHSKTLPREQEFACSWAPCFFPRYPQCCCSVKWPLFVVTRKMGQEQCKHTKITSFTLLPCWILFLK